VYPFFKLFVQYYEHALVEISESLEKTLLKMLVVITAAAGNPGMSLRSSSPGILLEIQDFLESSAPDRTKIPKAEVFLARKSLFRISDIPGFPAGGRNHSLALKQCIVQL
jgi:hypothetical protein